MKKIYTKDWMTYLPYRKSDEVDTYYVKVANKIASILKVLEEENDFSEADIHSISLYLTSWFQDIISNIGIWKTFTAECKKRYDMTVPFIDPEWEDDYDSEDINIDDIHFLLWHYCQCIKSKEGAVLNPENPGIESLAEDIYDYLFEEYEIAPENQRLYNLFYGKTFGKDDFYEFRNILEWFHFCSYVGFENREEMQNLMLMLQQQQNPSQIDLNLMAYGLKQDIIQESRKNLLSWTSVEWLAHLGETHPETAIWADCKTYPHGSFLYQGEEGECILVQDLMEQEKELLHIRKDSLNEATLKGLKKGESTIDCSLIYYGGAWWQSGTSVITDYTEEVQQHIKEQKHRKEEPQKSYEAFMKASGNQLFIFCRSDKEVEEFLTQKMNYKLKEGVSFPKPEHNSGLILTASRHTGIHIQMRLCECIYSPDSPFYDKEQAKKLAASFILNPEVIPYDLSYALQDKGMLPDACLNSIQGEEHGRELLKQYGKFLTDYFFRKYREKDF